MTEQVLFGKLQHIVERIMRQRCLGSVSWGIVLRPGMAKPIMLFTRHFVAISIGWLMVHHPDEYALLMSYVLIGTVQVHVGVFRHVRILELEKYRLFGYTVKHL